MSEDTDSNNETRHWSGDLLGRHQLADFLTKSLTEQARLLISSKNTGLTVALDADWGTGKTFFIKHWAVDLEAKGHPVVIFDAWENDIGDEAAVALMACIKAELEKWIQRLPNKQGARRKATEATKEALKGLRRAIIPASKIIATGIIKKATGIAVNEIFDAHSPGSDNTAEKISTATTETIETGLDELFKRALEDHNQRSAAINNFKTSIGQLIDLLESEAKAHSPVFVFVDEVDRCRPTYAIKLLEEIKHIFGISKICFVVSTNLGQLRESVCAIYGHGFDGHRYLKRFFDYQYTLPEPDNESFAAQLLIDGPAISSRHMIPGLPKGSKAATSEHAIALIATAFELDLRSQKQVAAIAKSVAAVIPKERSIFILWLFFLCALIHKKPNLYEHLLNGELDRTKFTEVCQEAFKRNISIEHISRSTNDRTPSVKKTKLSEVLWSYYTWSHDHLENLQDRRFEINQYSYPESNLEAIASEMPNPYDSRMRYKPSIASYTSWVKYAGLAQQES